MAKQKNLDPHRMQAIAWRDGQKKEIVVKCLNHPAVLAAMDETAKQNTGEMVLWGARKLRELGMAGKLDINEPVMFGKPEEVKNLEERIRQLETTEDDYVKTVNEATQTITELERLLKFYRGVVKAALIEVQEDKGLWHRRGEEFWYKP